MTKKQVILYTFDDSRFSLCEVCPQSFGVHKAGKGQEQTGGWGQVGKGSWVQAADCRELMS